jgi:WD40 repeat protein
MNSDLWPLDPSERVEIAPLRGATLAEAIGKPAEKVGVYLEAGLVERLLADAADEPGVLPLVQETMVLLWDKRERRLLPLRTYEELGQGNLSGLAVAIATRADAVFAQLDESQRKIARRIFLRLVQFGEGRADTRRQQRVSTLRAAGDEPNEFERTLKHLTDHRLLTLTGEEKDANRQVDIAHEALIAGWQRFRQWLNERRDAEQTRRRLEDKAREWERLGRGNAGLLDDVELREAENWLRSADATDLGYSETLPELIDISRAEIQQAEREKEEARQRELAQAKALANEQKQRAESERRARVRQRYFTIGLAVFLVIAIVAAGVALTQYKEVLTQKQSSDSRRLAAQSQNNLDQSFDLALLLGLEAHYLDDNAETRGNLLDLLTNKSQLDSYLYEHSTRVDSLAFSPDGRILASGGGPGDNSVILWDLGVHRAIGRLTGHRNSVSSIAFSPDGKTIASTSCGKWDSHYACQQSEILFWDVTTQKTKGPPIAGHTNIVTILAFSRDGKTLASASDDNTIILWNVSAQQPIGKPLTGNNDKVTALSFSPDGKTIATVSINGITTIWNTFTQQLISQRFTQYDDGIYNLSFSLDGKSLVSGVKNAEIIHWVFNTSSRLAFSPDNQILVSGSLDGTINLRDSSTQEPIGRPLSGHTQTVSSVAFSPDGKTIASGSWDKTIILWNIQIVSNKPENKRKSIKNLLGEHQSSIRKVAFDPSGKILASVSNDSTIILWDTSTYNPIGQPLDGYQIAFSPNGKMLASANCSKYNSSGCEQSEIILRDVVTRQPIGESLSSPTNTVNDIAFSPDSKIIASAGCGKHDESYSICQEGQVILWDIATRQQFGQPLIGLRGDIDSVIFSPDGKMLASVISNKWTMILWDLSSSQPIRKSLESFAYTFAFSPDGKMFVTGSLNNTIILWDSNTRRPIGQPFSERKGYDSYKSAYIPVEFSPDGKTLASGDFDNTIILWEVKTRQPIGRPLTGHFNYVHSVSFSPDGKTLASGDEDGKVILWNVDIDSWVAIACHIANRNLTRGEWAKYIDPTPSTYRATCPGLPLEPVATPTPKP